MEPKQLHQDAEPSRHAELELPLLPLNKLDTTENTKTNSLAFLDGLRGIAALIVYNHHHITDFYGIDCDLMHAWGYQGRHLFGQLPFVHLFFSGGTAAVMIFFVLSGYVLSRGVLQMIQTGKSSSTILQYLLNATLRRPIRLWLPPIMVSLPVALAFHTPLRPVGAFLDIQSNVFREIPAYTINLLQTINPLIGHGPFQQSFQYDPPVWTMAYELNGSVLIYAIVAVFGPLLNLSVRSRMVALAIIAVISFEYGHFSLLPFMLGMIIAQLDVASLDQLFMDRMPEQRRNLILNAMFVAGWYLLSDIGPAVKPEHPWFGIPPEWLPYFYYHNPNMATNVLGACCVVYAALRLSWLQSFLNRAAWLGKVSFALYLTHVPIIWFLSYRVRRCFGAEVPPGGESSFFDGMLAIPDVGPQGFSTRYLAMQLVVLPANLLLADAVTTWIDQGSVTVSKKFAKRVMQKLHL